jgi:antitoxin FitA
MSEITITLPDDSLRQLTERAAQIGITAEELARASIQELLTQSDEEFEEIIDYILEKNAELYRRLAG